MIAAIETPPHYAVWHVPRCCRRENPDAIGRRVPGVVSLSFRRKSTRFAVLEFEHPRRIFHGKRARLVEHLAMLRGQREFSGGEVVLRAARPISRR